MSLLIKIRYLKKDWIRHCNILSTTWCWMIYTEITMSIRLCLYLSVCTVYQAQVLYDGSYSAVFIWGGVTLWVEAEVGAEQQILPHTQGAHQNIVLETQGWCKHKQVPRICGIFCKKKSLYMFIFVYLNHIGRAEPQVRCDRFSIYQHASLAQPSRVFSSCYHIQQTEIKSNTLIFTWFKCEAGPVSVF